MLLQPFGVYKAFNLAVVHEILTSVLAAGPIFAGESTGFVPFDGAMNTSFGLLAIDISAFRPMDEFEAAMEEMIGRIKAVPLAPEATGISFAGERSQDELARRRASGIPLAGGTLERLNQLVNETGLEPIPT